MVRPDYDTAALRTPKTHAMFLITTVESHEFTGHCLIMGAKFEVDDTIKNRGNPTPAAANSSTDLYSSTEDYKVTLTYSAKQD